MLRTFWAIVAGGVAGIVTMIVMESIGSLIFPMPLAADLSKAGASLTYVDQMPIGAKAVVILGWAAGSYVSSMLALRWSPKKDVHVGWIAGASVFVAGALGLALIPHPWWMWVLGLAALTVPAWYAAERAAPRPIDMREAP